MNSKQKSLIGKATYTMFEKNEKKRKFQKFFKLVCGFYGFHEGRGYSECAIARFAKGPRNMVSKNGSLEEQRLG